MRSANGPRAIRLTVREERDGDQERIRSVNDAAFGGPVESRIIEDIRGTDRWLEGGSIVAEDADGTIVGHLLLSEGDLLLEGGGTPVRVWMVGPVAVLPERQRQGIGGALMRAAIALATSRRQPLLCLLGHETYYPRFGFEPARRIGIQPPKPWPDANWLALRLPDWNADLRGTARFPPAFPD